MDFRGPEPSGNQFRGSVCSPLNFTKNQEFIEIPWKANRAHELNFRRVSDPKILCGPALRAMFKISAAPRAPLTRGDSTVVLAGVRAV